MKYIGYYDSAKDRRYIVLSAVHKMDYICNALYTIGEKITIVSCSTSANKTIPSCIEKINDNVYVKYFKAKKRSRNKLIRIANYAINNMKLFLYLIKNVKKDEQVIVYHSLGLMRVIYYAKKIKKFKMILEVEEFYNDVVCKSTQSANFERKFIGCADKYIFSAELLNEKFNTKNKPYVIVHGTYNVEEDRNVSFNDNKIHIVYAGTFDPVKKGAITSVLTGKYLDERFHMHILGFGTKEDTENIKKLIDEINKESQAIVTYDGLLSGDEYIEFLQKCHIGMSTQNADAAFNNTSFPSKILSYMANGLRVVTVDIPVVRESIVGENVYYYLNNEPEDIARVIENINVNSNYDGRKILKELNLKFCDELKRFLLIK